MKIWVLIGLMIGGLELSIFGGIYIGEGFVWGGLALFVLSTFLLGREVGRA